MVPRQKMYTVKSLKLSAVNVVVDRLLGWENLSETLASEDLMLIVVNFRAVAGPITRLLVEHTSFFITPRLCCFFLYEFMKEKKVKLYGPYATQIVNLIVDFELFDSEVLQTVSELNIDQCSSYKRDELFSKFPNLQKLRIRRGLTDETLISIAQHFPELTVLDAMRDSSYTITDHGLLHLTRLKKLRCILLYPVNRERKCTNPTGNGLALLVTRLPELVKLTCPGFLLRDALNVLHLTRSLLLTVKSLNFGESYIDIHILIAVSNVCPNLERLKIFVSGFKRYLEIENYSNFTGLQELHVDKISTLWKAHAIYGFRSVWRQLSVLYLDEFGFRLYEMLTVSESCPNVSVLSFGGDLKDNSLSLQKCLGVAWPLLFPRLQILDLFGGKLSNLYFLLHKRSNLVKVSITGKDDEISVLESLMPCHGFWPKVEIMSITILDRNNEEVYDQDENLSRHLVEVFQSLKQIFVCIDKDEEGVILTSSRGNEVAVCSNETFNVFTKEPEFDVLDCYEMESID